MRLRALIQGNSSNMKPVPRVSPVMNLLRYCPSGQLAVTRSSGKPFCSVGVSARAHQMCFVIIHSQSSDLKLQRS